LTDFFEGDASAGDVGQDLVGGGGPDEGGASGVVRVRILRLVTGRRADPRPAVS